MAGKQTKNVFIETQYDNIVLINPNQLADSDGKAVPRLVDHEDMVFYANLETFIIPRTKLAIGESFDNSVVNTTIASLTSEKDLKINFLQPKGKSAFDTSWSDQFTGKESRQGKSSNQKFENLTTRNGEPTYINRTEKFEDTQILGIKNINVTVGATGVPKVTIEMTDVQGKMLFEQGENSMYSVFFNFPYPLFYLTLKGYYGKAIRYRLALTSFNSRFDSNTGSFDITLELIGKFTALLMDTPLSYGRTAPKMFPAQVSVKKNSQSTEITNVTTTRGKIILDEVYSIYKAKKLIPENFPPHTIDTFLTAVSNYETKLLEGIKNGDFSVLNDVERFREILLDLKETLYTNAKKNYLDNTSFYVFENKKYYPFKKSINFADREKYKTLADDRIKYFIGELKKNKTFGENGTYKKSDGSKLATEINVWSKIKNKNIIIKNFPLQQWFESRNDINNTRYYRTGEKLDLTTTEGQNKLQKFIFDEKASAPGKVLDLTTNQLVDEPLDMYFYGDDRIDNGVYEINSFLDIINDSLKQLEVKENQIDDDLSKILADRVVNGFNGVKGIGFKPTIRNVFAILFAGVDTFFRLMEDTHQKAWDVRNNTTRLLSVIPPEKNFSVDGLNSIQTSSGELNNQNIVYPWPLYFTKERQDNGSELYTIQYPGDSKIINQTQGWNTSIWPEVHFVEEFAKASLLKETTENKPIYNNPKTDTTLASPNALFYPFYSLPYENIESVSILYEILERAIINAEYNRFNYDEIEKKQIDSFFADIEGQNVVSSISSSLELQDLLREFKFNYQNYLNYLKIVSNNGAGQSWNNYKQEIFNTKYIVNSINEQKEVYSIETIAPTNSLTISTEDLYLSKNLKNYLESSKTNSSDLYDTFPFTNINWLKSNLANGNSLNTKEDFYDTTKTFIYFDDKKTIARLNQTETNKNIQLFTSKHSFKNSLQPYLTNVTNGIKISDRTSLNQFFTDRKPKDLYFTESYVDYGNSYSGNVGTKIQTTSLLNTPYFINALLEGVDKETNKEEDAYVSLGYLYLNSLPLITTKERLKSFDDNNIATDLDYLAATIKKYSAIHQLPYAWVLKYGSIWHRYKKFSSTGVDILDTVWKDFDYKVNYDPVTSATTKEYVIPNYTGGQETIYLQKNEIIPNMTGKTVDLISTGFYPKVVNQVYKYFSKKDLFTGYTQDAFFKSYNENYFRIGKNNLSTNFLNFGFDKNNLNRSLLKTNYYQYLDAEKNTDFTGKFYMLFPSMGGIPFDQSIYETVDNTNNLKIEITGNTSVYNGSVRSLWGTSQFGYFNNNVIKKPKPTEYLKTINVQSSEQNAFDLKGTDSEYSYIDEILSIFTTELLDKFEELFLTFCNYKPTADKLILKGEVQAPSYTDTNIIKNLKYRRLYNQISQLFLIGKTSVTLSDENIDGLSLGQKQVVSFVESVKNFLSFDCIVKNANPGSFDRLLFNSFSSLQNFVPTNKLTFNPYVKGTLPGDGTNVTLSQSIAQNKDAWNALRTYVGFSSIPGVDFQTQAQTQYPSVSLIQPQPQQTQTPIQNNSIISGQTMQNLCTGDYFNVVDPDYQSAYGLYQDNTVLFLETTDQAGVEKNFCAKKVPNSGSTITYDLVSDTGFSNGNLGGLSQDAYCLSYFSQLLNCPQSNQLNQISLKYFGESSVILPTVASDLGWSYINVKKTGGGYKVFKIEDPTFNSQKIASIRFFPENSDVTVLYNSYAAGCSAGLNTNNAHECSIDEFNDGNFQLQVDYYPNAPTNLLGKMTLNVKSYATTQPQNSVSAPSNPQPITNTTQQSSNVNQTQTTPQKSYITDFFIDMDIEFTEDNIKTLATLIKIYATQKEKNPTYSKTNFNQSINDVLNNQLAFKEKLLNKTFAFINKNTPKVTVQGQEQIDRSSISSDVTKLTTYNLLKGFNDKWVAGSDLKTRTIFEDFLFMDRSNSDIGDSFIVDIKQVKERIERNPKQNMMQIVSWILNDNYFQFFPMPAYINFYGIQKQLGDNTPKQDITVGNDLFGTHLNVDYLESSPKFLCLYIGNPSEWPKPKENSFIRFGDDSFDLRITDNPLRVSDPNLDISKSNKVVGFAVDFGIQNQNIFKDLDLDMSEKKETSETFKIYADLGDSVSGDKVAQQSVSMYSIYKSRSYTCGVTSLGNVMIQPTMYFALRHVPLFYGPYWIMEVTHSVSETDFSTKFKGVRMRRYSLPKVDNLVASVNKNVLKSFKESQRKEMPNIETNDEKTLEVDPKPTLQSSEIACSGKSLFDSVSYVNLKPTQITINDLVNLLNAKTNSKIIKTIVLTIALTRPTNTLSDGVMIQSNNANVYGIFTNVKYGGELNNKIKNQTCAKVNGETYPMADFQTYDLSNEFMLSFYQNIELIIEELNKFNINIDQTLTIANSIAQCIYVTWDTKKAFIGGFNGKPLNVQQYKEVSLADKESGTFTYYDFYLKTAKEVYSKF
jgi:hypothetical protein